MEATNWAPAHAAALREYLALGMSYAEIARAINAKFNTNYSRNAAISRARRMGLAGTERPDDSGRPPEGNAVADLHISRERYDIVARWFAPRPVKIPKLRCAAIEPRHLTLLQLEPGDCRYPYGGDEEGEAITFCGHPKREESSYCTAHFHLTNGPGAVSERGFRAALLGIVEVV
jgi:GcrA cell cycle regulator